MRIRRNCTSLTDFVFFSSIIARQLENRGYNKVFLDKVFSMVYNLKKRDLLEYKQKRQHKDRNDFFFKHTFDKNILNMNSILYKSFELFKNGNYYNKYLDNYKN